MKKAKMRRRIAHLEHRLFQELPVLQLENDFLRAAAQGKGLSIPTGTPVMQVIAAVARATRTENAQRGGYPGYYPDPQTTDQEC